jgi:uncharacterized protein involved in tolerance to divalent cations
MFISKSEKEEMRISIRTLQSEVKELRNQIENLAKYVTKNVVQVEVKRKGHQWSDESKREASERMKKFWADRKTQKETS